MSNNLIETIDEVGFVMIHSIIMVFSLENRGNFIVTKSMKNLLGWIMIGLIVFILVSKCYMMIKEEIIDMKESIKEFCRNRKKKTSKRIFPSR